MEEQKKKLRKYENTLTISGTAVIAFGVWSIAKDVLYYLQDLSRLWEGMAAGGEITTGDKVSSVISMVIVLAIDLALRLYMGRSARAEGRGEIRSRRYMVIAWIIVVFNLLFGIVIAVFAVKLSETGVLITGFFVELTAIFAMAEMAHSAGRVKKLRAEIARERAQ